MKSHGAKLIAVFSFIAGPDSGDFVIQGLFTKQEDAEEKAEALRAQGQRSVTIVDSLDLLSIKDHLLKERLGELHGALLRVEGLLTSMLLSDTKTSGKFELRLGSPFPVAIAAA